MNDDELGISDEPSGKHRVPLEQYADVELGPLPPIAPDGGFAPGPIGLPPPVPAATPEQFICLRGPCRHYWQISTYIASGNPKETWGEGGLVDLETGEPLREPRQISRSCRAQPGIEIELTEDCVYECNLWDPQTPRELVKIRKRREKYYRSHPDHRPKET